MYGTMGETELERQARLQADADAERAINTLRESQIGSLPEITVKGNPTVFYILAAAILTGLLFPLGSKRRSLWLLAMLLPSVLAAQSPFVDTVVVTTDTFIVYGKQTVTVSTTIDSIVVRKPTPPPVIVLGKGYGASALIHDAPQPYTPFNASSGEAANTPDMLLSLLTKAKQRKVRVVANLPCGGHNPPTNPGNCLAQVNGVWRFSKAKFDSAMTKYNTPAVRAAVLQAYRDSVLTAVNLMDEPWVTGGGDGNTWGPVPLPRQLVDSLCLSGHNALGPVPVGTSDQPKWQRSAGTYKWRWCDVGIAQFSYRFGQPAAWRDSVLTESARQGYASIFQYNIINGGTQDRDGTWDCAQQGGTKGQRSPNCTMTPDQIVLASTAIGASGCGPLGMWRYDSTRFTMAKFQPAFNSVGDLQAQRPVAVCKVR